MEEERIKQRWRDIEAREPDKGGTAMRQRRKKPDEVIGVEVGLGGLFKGISGLFDLVSEMVEEGKDEVTRSGEKDILGGKGKALYGFSVRMGGGGRPIIESFGNVRPTPSGPVVAEVREPLADIFDEGDEVRVIAEIPGVDEKDIHVEIKDDILTLTAQGRDRKYEKEVLLPSPVKPQFKQSCRNGILELKLGKRK